MVELRKATQENQLTQDLELLMQVIDSRLQSLATINSNFHYQGSADESSATQNSITLNYSRKDR